MNSDVAVIEEDNLSTAWGRAFLETIKPGVTEVSPLIMSISGFNDGVPSETPIVRDLLEHKLHDLHCSSIETVASTIFPKSLWNPALDRSTLFNRYLSILPRIRKCRPNVNGTYFERLIAFGDNEPFNQLEHVIQTYQGGNHRRSALQATIFDPLKDHTDQRQRGFPCLQLINFTPIVEKGSLEVSGFYANQYMFTKAYGNYLGLARLGRFVAHELGFTLTRVICIASNAQLGKENKSALTELADDVATAIS